jgi:hypothetical protein
MVRAAWRYGFVAVGFLVALVSAFVASGVRADLFVSSDSIGTVLQYDQNTGNFIADFAGGGIGGTRGVLIGPDGNLYLASSSLNSILRYDPTGNLIDIFVAGGSELSGPRGIIFGPDGNLYVSSKNTSSVVHYNGTTGLLMDTFVAAGSGGLNGPRGLVFGPESPCREDRRVLSTTPRSPSCSQKVGAGDHLPTGGPFRKLLERSGLKKELQMHSHYQKPCESGDAQSCVSNSLYVNGHMPSQNGSNR